MSVGTTPGAKEWAELFPVCVVFIFIKLISTKYLRGFGVLGEAAD